MVSIQKEKEKKNIKKRKRKKKKVAYLTRATPFGLLFNFSADQ
jgi:hypothetical protein